MTSLLVSTTGGHLTELFDLSRRMPGVGDDRLWVTHDNAQSRSLLEGEDVEFVPYIGVKDMRGVSASVFHAHRLLKERSLRRVLSAGSGIALGYLPYLAARGVEAHYIESAARADAPSLAGRLLRFAPGVHSYTQYPELAAGRLRYIGSVFDGFVASNTREPTVIRRAVVTIGTAAEFPFRRVLDALVPLLGPGGVLERQQGSPIETLWQTGGTPTDGLDIEARPWLPAAELADALADADVAVSHAGVGSALSALGAGRCPLLIPRELAHGEVGDEHQRQLALTLADRGIAIHRSVREVTPCDLRAAAGRSVERTAPLPNLKLVS